MHVGRRQPGGLLPRLDPQRSVAGKKRRCATSSSAWLWPTGTTATAGSVRCCGGRAGASTTSAWSGSCARTTCCAWRNPCSGRRRQTRATVGGCGRTWRAISGPWPRTSCGLPTLTYVRLAEAFIYLAVMLDAFSRKVVGWAMADHLRASLALDALEMALGSREVIAGGLVHHSDRGIQLGFNQSSQQACGPTAETRQMPRRASSSRGSFAAWC